MSRTEQPKLAASYARVSMGERQHLETQLGPLREYVARAGWQLTREYSDETSGAKERRPGLDRLLADARSRRIKVVVVWKLDRLGRSLSHLIRLLDEFRELGIDFISTTQGIDTTTATGRLMLQLLGAIAEFERSLIQERVRAGMARARREGRILGRPRKEIDYEALRKLKAEGKSIRQIARALGLSKSKVATEFRRELQRDAGLLRS